MLRLKVSKKCVGCAQCIAYCPYDAIEVCGHATMNDRCVECGVCVEYCPICAIIKNFELL